MRQEDRELSLRITNYINSKSPVTFPNGLTLEFRDLVVDIPEENYNIDNQLSMKYSGKGSTEGKIGATVVISDQDGNEVSKKVFKSLFKFPVRTERDTFIVNGIEKSILSQIRSKPGAYTGKNSGTGVTKTEFMFSRKDAEKYMPQMSFVYNATENTFIVDISSFKSFKPNIVNFLTILGFTDMEIQASLGNDMFAESIIMKYSKARNAKTVDDLFKVFYPRGVKSEELLTDKKKLELIYDFLSRNALFEKKSKVIETNLGVKNTSYMTKDVISKAVKKTMSVAIGMSKEDDRDDLKYKDVYKDTDLIMEAFQNDFEQFLDSSMSLMDVGTVGTDKASWIMNSLGKTSSLKSVKELLSSDLTRASEQVNPLHMESLSSTITMLGDKGMSKDAKRNEENARKLTASGMNRIDPVHTPESDNIGLVQHLTIGAKIENNSIKSPFYKVINEVATINEKKKIYLEPVDEEKHIVAFNDSRYVLREGDKLTFKADMVPARYMGKTDMYPVSKIEFIDASANSILSTAGNLIPFVSHDDGARVLMGASMQGQAINLVNREKPMVTTLADKNSGATFNDQVGEKQGKPIRSTVNGTVKDISKSSITITDKKGKDHVYQYHRYYPLNQSFINNELKVSVGDMVTVGQILAEGWQTKDGSLALGVNARVGFLPYKGYNYEDGVVISESFSNKTLTDEANQLEFEISKDFIGGRGSAVKNELSAYTVSSAVSKLDIDGIIKEGEYVKSGSVIVAGLKEVNKGNGGLSSLDILRLNGQEKVLKYSEIQIPQGSYTSGKVVRVEVVNNPDAAHKQKIVLTISSQKPLKVGDKISGRHGNKGTITKILPDNLMPSTEDGRPLDLLFSPLAVPSRKNPGQILEVNAGLISEITGKPYVVDNFNHNEKDRVLEDLKKIGCPDGKMKVMIKEEDDEGNIIDVPVENDVTVGNMYIMKLKHKVDEKIQARGNLETYVTNKERMPGKIVGSEAGEKGNPQSMGEMEMRALQGHGAVWNLLESSTIKADGGGDAKARQAMYRAIATGNLDSADLKGSASPETMKVMSDYLKTIGFNVKPMYHGKEVAIDKPFDSIGIVPLNGEEFVKSIGQDKEVFKSGALRPRQLMNDSSSKTNGKRPETENGLMDPNIFGDKDVDDENEIRNKWGYIKLATPVPNPTLFEATQYNPYSLLTGVKKRELDKINNGENALIVDPTEFVNELTDIDDNLKNDYLNYFNEGLKNAGFNIGDVVPVSEVDKLVAQGLAISAKTGGAAINHMLSKVDVLSALDEAKKDLDAQTSPTAITKAYKKVRCLEMLTNNNLAPTDLMVKYVPVAPSYLRPISLGEGNKQVIVDDLNKLYDKIITASNNAKSGNSMAENGFIDTVRSDVKSYGANSASVYKALARLDGSIKTTDRTGKDLVTALGSSKTPGVFAGKEGLFRDKMLSKRLDFSGRSVIGVDPNLNMNEVGLPMDMAKQLYKPFIIKEIIKRGLSEPNESAALSKLNKMDSEVKAVIQDIANDRPVILNRQPSLHKFSMQALKPVIKDYEDGSVVRSIQLNPLVVTGFNADFDGDTMAVHVPITEKAKEEAKELMLPTQNLINPTDGTFVVEIRHEMALGLYQLTKTWKNATGTPIPYNNFVQLRKDYLTGKVNSNQAVIVPICTHPTTVGQALFNWILPDKFAHYRNFKKDWDKKSISNMIMNIYKEAEKGDFKTVSRMDIANILDKLKKVGFEASTRSGVSIGSSDFTKLKEISAKIEKADKKGITLDEWKSIEDDLKKSINDGLLGEDNPLHIMMKSGARASSGQVLKMVGMVGTGMDINKKSIDPIASSHFDGLSPQEYFRLGHDSRKGMYDRSVSTSAPGQLTREVWSATQDIVVKETDCKTKEFIMIKKSDATIKGRYSAKDILDKNGKVICGKNQMITNDVYASIYSDDTIEYVAVRSPLRCKVPHGVCQKCYGAMPGTNTIVKLGTAVGVLASQAMGEPVTQMTMNTFHTGGANSAATLGLPRINNILNLSDDLKTNKAVIVDKEGIVTKIEDTPTSTIVHVGKKKYAIKKPINSQAPKLKVKVGDMVYPGDFLTVGDIDDINAYMDDNKTQIVITNAAPKDLFERKSKHIGQEEAMNYTRDYLTDSMQYAVKKSDAYMDRRHAETIVSKLTSISTIVDAGDSPFLKGQDVDTKTVNRWNELNCKPKSVPVTNKSEIIGKVLSTNVRKADGTVVAKAGQVIDAFTADTIAKAGIPSVKVSLRPAQIKMTLESTGKTSVYSRGHDNWLSNSTVKDVRQQITRGATFGQVDKLNDPRSRLITGNMLNVGEGMEMPDTISSGMKNSMLNFFSPTLDQSIEKAKKKEK